MTDNHLLQNFVVQLCCTAENCKKIFSKCRSHHKQLQEAQLSMKLRPTPDWPDFATFTYPSPTFDALSEGITSSYLAHIW